MYKVKLMGMEIGASENRKIIDIIKEHEEGDISNIIACKVDNDIKSLNYEINDDVEIKYIYNNSSDGMRIYIRGLSLIMIKAFEDLYPNAKVNINYSLGEALYCDIENIEIVDEVVVAVRERMKEIIENNLPIEFKFLPKNVVKKMYIEDGHSAKLGLLNSNIESQLLLYYLEDTYGYFYGEMPISTGYIKTFDLKKYADGVLLMYPNKKDISIIKASDMNKKLHATLNEYEDFYKKVKIKDITDLNNSIIKGKINDIIRISEAMHEKKIANIADMIKRNSDKKVILIAGPSSSGKTTFAQRLAIQLKINDLNPITISVDNYFVERDENPIDENGNYDFECLEAIDLNLFNNHLSRLLNGEEIEMPEFNFATGHKEYKGNKVKMNDSNVLVIEGIHALNDELTKSIPLEKKFKIFISALTVLNIDRYNRISTTDTRLIRRIIRDSKFRSYPIDKTLAMWKSVRNGEDKYIFPFQETADVMFNSSLPYEFAIFKFFAEPLLLTVTEDSPYYSEAKRLYELLSLFLPLETKEIPINSILREFTGEGCFYR